MNKYLIFGDLSGYFDQFLRLVKNTAKDVIIIVLGDVPDRGPKTKELIEFLISHPQIIWVMGNHEHMMVQCFNHIIHKTELSSLYNLPYWIYVNGGDATLKSYGIHVNYLVKNDPKQTRNIVKNSSFHDVYNLSQSNLIKDITEQFDKIPQSHISYMEKLPLIWKDDNIIATHAPVLDWNDSPFFDLKLIEKSDNENNVLWNRNFSYNKSEDKRLHVFGHCNLDTICIQTENNPNWDILDINSKISIPKNLSSICLDISQTGHILALEYPQIKLHKVKMD